MMALCHKAVLVAARRAQPSVHGPVVQSSRPDGITPDERAQLNGRLAHLEDALFDYDESTIRADSVLKDDVGVIRGILAKDPSEKLRIEGHL